MKQISKIIFLFLCGFSLLIGCSNKVKTKSEMSLKRIKHSQQKIFDLAENDYDIKISGAKNSPPGPFSFNEIGSQMGFAVVSADVNGDNIDDLIIGAPNSGGPLDRSFKSGWVYIFFGKKSTVDAELSAKNADVKMFGGKSNRGALLGSSLAAADINGDGSADIIIGAPGAKEKSSGKSRRTGKVYVIYGKKS